MSAPATSDLDELVFTAKALAQSHPFGPAGAAHQRRMLDAERDRQPLSEMADWAGAALVVGYCVRRAEEQAAGASVELVAPGTALDEPTVAAAMALSRRAEQVTLLDAEVTLALLDRVIAGEVAKRWEHLAESLGDDDWRSLEQHLAWWVLHGYSLRIAESGGLA
jgi:hypothetical protein